MKTELKIKILTLTAEARIIKRQEKRWRKRPLNQSLHNHRVHVVRPAARAAHLAYGFLRGRPYAIMEQIVYKDVDWDAVEKNALTHGIFDKLDAETGKRIYVGDYAVSPQELKQRFARWRDEADEHLEKVRTKILEDEATRVMEERQAS